MLAIMTIDYAKGIIVLSESKFEGLHAVSWIVILRDVKRMLLIESSVWS